MKHNLFIAVGICLVALFINDDSANAQSQVFNPVEDAFVRGGEYSNENSHNHSDGLYVKQGSVSTFFRKAFVKFDLTGYELDHLGNALLKLYCYKLEKPLDVSYLTAYEISNDWEEHSVTWADSPDFLSNLGHAAVVLDDYLVINVTSYIQAAIQEGKKEVSFGLSDGHASNNGLFFHNKLGAYPPQLLLDEEALEVDDILTATYYVDALDGDDQSDGLTEETAWQTLEHINDLEFGPGAHLLFKSGQSWNGNLQIHGSGEAGNPFVIGKYGEGPRPAIHGNGVFAAVHLQNVEYTVLRDLEVTNYNPAEEDGKSMEAWEAWNVSDWLEVNNPPQHVSGNTRKIGVYVTATDMGVVNQVHLINLRVHAVNGDIDQGVEATKNNGGIAIEITGSLIPTWFNDLLVEGCHIHDVDRTGLYNSSTWSTRTLNSNTNWTPSQNFVIRNNVFERAGANALIVRVAENPLIEHNLFCSNGIKGSGNAAFNFNTDGALWQFNESRFTKKNQNDADAGGIDSDYRTKNTVIQYNYLHNNDFGMLVTGGPSNWGGFNDRTIVRYNIFERDGLVNRDAGPKFSFKIGGNATNTFVHNNVFYLSEDQSDTEMVYHRNWGGNPHNSIYYNNIFYLEGSNHGYDLGASTGNVFHNNLFFGNTTISWPDSPESLFADPLFELVGQGPDGYTLMENSPALNQGVIYEIIGTAQMDYFGKDVPQEGNVDIGAHQLSPGTIVSIISPDEDPADGVLVIYPMPVSELLNVSVSGLSSHTARFYLVDMHGASILLGENPLVGGEGKFVFKLSGYALQPGMYALMVNAGHGTLSRKLIYSGK